MCFYNKLTYLLTFVCIWHKYLFPQCCLTLSHAVFCRELTDLEYEEVSECTLYSLTEKFEELADADAIGEDFDVSFSVSVLICCTVGTVYYNFYILVMNKLRGFVISFTVCYLTLDLSLVLGLGQDSHSIS